MTWIRRGSRDGGDPGHCAVTDITRRKVFRSADIFDCHANRRSACHTAIKANPHSDVAPLDLAAAADAEVADAGDSAGSGPASEAQRTESPDSIIRRDVIDRCDEDLPDRTQDVIARRNWLAS